MNINKISYLVFKMRRLFSRVFDINKNKTFYGNTILSIDKGSNVICRLLQEKKPIMIGRIGASEMVTINSGIEVKLSLNSSVDKKAKELIYNNAGFFPKEDKWILKFIDEYMDCAKSCDYFAVFGHHHGDYFYHYFAKEDVIFGTLRSLEPYYTNDPWTKALTNKRVCVIHPFEKSIISQYEKRDLLFENQSILPDFSLLTVKSVQSVGDNTGGFSNWFEALDHMKRELVKKDFDIALLGCGAYAFPLAAYIKSELKKQSVILGGALQILFGIKGARWDNHPIISKLYNEHWVYPLEEEIPDGHKKIENGCYW